MRRSRRSRAELSEAETGDTSAHTVLAERAEAEQARVRRDADLLKRGRQIDRNRIIQGARRLARIDRREDRLLGR
jgi:hypothetical protein